MCLSKAVMFFISGFILEGGKKTTTPDHVFEPVTKQESEGKPEPSESVSSTLV